MNRLQELEAENKFLKLRIEELERTGKHFIYENDELRPMTEEERDFLTNRKYYKYWEIEATTRFGHQLNDIDRYKETLPTFYWCFMESLKRAPYARNASGVRAIENANGEDIISKKFMCYDSDDFDERVTTGKMRLATASGIYDSRL